MDYHSNKNNKFFSKLSENISNAGSKLEEQYQSLSSREKEIEKKKDMGWGLLFARKV